MKLPNVKYTTDKYFEEFNPIAPVVNEYEGVSQGLSSPNFNDIDLKTSGGTSISVRGAGTFTIKIGGKTSSLSRRSLREFINFLIKVEKEN